MSSVIAPAGQVDYVAANAFLDSFAAGYRRNGVMAINWGPWRDVGIAARSLASHPLLGRRLVDTPGEIVVTAHLNDERHWMLAEHCVRGGKAVVPGTGYLEMACATLTRGSFERGVTFEDVFFVTPMLAEPGQTKEVHVTLRRSPEEAYRFTVRAREAEWVEHASGSIGRCTQPPPPDRDVEAIAVRMPIRREGLRCDASYRTGEIPQFRAPLAVPSWATHRRGGSVAQLDLAEDVATDLAAYPLHPAHPGPRHRCVPLPD